MIRRGTEGATDIEPATGAQTGLGHIVSYRDCQRSTKTSTVCRIATTFGDRIYRMRTRRA